MKLTVKVFRELIDNLPHAFDKIYWSLGNTTYKEEVFLTVVIAFKIPQKEALKFQSKIYPKNRLLRQILKGEVIEYMGTYEKFNSGAKFYDNIKL